MVLSELTNKELKGILRENDVRNYSKMNKKGLLKKVNQLIKAQNGGNSGKGKNGKKKKYTLKDFIGGRDPTDPTAPPAAPAVGTPPAGAPAAPAVGNPPANPAKPVHGPPAEATATAPAGPPATIAKPIINPPTVNKNSTVPAQSTERTNIRFASAPPTENNAPPRRVYMPTNNGSINPSNTVKVPNPYLNPNYTPTNYTSNINRAKNKNKSTDECGSCSIL